VVYKNGRSFSFKIQICFSHVSNLGVPVSIMMFSRVFLSAITAAVLAVAAPVAQILQAADGAEIIPDNWIVVMKDGLSDASFLSHLAGRDSNVVSATKSTFNLGSFKGYSGIFSQSLLDLIATSIDASYLLLPSLTPTDVNDQIAYIEPDTKVKTSALTTQSNAPWGLGRISHREPGSTDYIYDDSAGSGTFSYIIDTGIYTQHTEFEDRATFGANFAGDGEDFDGNGHGTHVSGTIGSRAYGVAKKTNLIGVKVLDASGSGANSGVISGIEWAVNDAKSKGRIGRALANMSLGGVLNKATNQAVAAAVKAGLFMGIAAGNDGLPAALFSPASEKTACTVGATDKTDARASYSNFGSVVDIFAPGSEILSTWIDGPDDTNTISGTSMATPHVIGLGAYLIGLEGASQPQALCERIRQLATADALSGVGGLSSDGLIPGEMRI